MFVFPAFDSNYQSRKRTFKCCESCRVKKTKCDITSINYELNGCKNCIKHDLKCSLVKQKPKKALKNEGALFQVKPDLKNDSDMTLITNQYLHDTFGFNIASHNDLTFDFMSHDDPKIIVSNQDIRNYQGQGILLQNNKEFEINSIKQKNRNKDYHIKSLKFYNFLLSISAFTLSSDRFKFSKNDEIELIKLFFLKVNSVLPIVHERLFWEDYSKEQAITTFIYAMVLVISRDDLAKPILKRAFNVDDDEGYFKLLRIFIEELEFKIRQILLVSSQLGDEDKISRIGLYLLLSLHFNYDKWGNEQSVNDLTNAIDISTGIAIHLKRPIQVSAELHTYTCNLWWCCYVMDKMSALVNCRPFFVKTDDFNIDLPYDNLNLLKMVQLARNIENVIIYLFRPYVVPMDNFNTSSHSPLNKFDIDKFQDIEFESCDKERKTNRINYNFDIGSDQHVFQTIQFLSRIVNNVLIMKSQKRHYENPNIPNHIPESVAVKAGSNVLWYMNQLPHKYLLNIPMVPLCMSLSMAMALKQTARSMVDHKYHFMDHEQYKDELQFEDYISKLEYFAPFWWVVDEICKVTRVFMKNLHEKKTGKRKRTLVNDQGDESEMKKSSFDKESTGILENQRETPVQYIHPTKSIVSNLETLEIFQPSQNAPSLETMTSQHQFDQYFESMQLDIFNDEFFLDLKNVIGT